VRERIMTERLVLVPLSAEVARAVIGGDLSGLRAGKGWPHADTLDGLRMAVEHDHDSGWLVTLDGVVIGDCGTHGHADPAGDIEMGYGLAAPYRGLGYGTELVEGLSQWLLGQPGVQRIVVRNVLADNVPSRRALERAGFVIEQVDEGHVSYTRARE
jgi:RimJ/RimL family protein N-acetyltransferase